MSRKQLIGIGITLLSILYVTLFSRTPTLERSVQLDLLWSYLSRGHAQQILLNIALFIPLGFFLSIFCSGYQHRHLWTIISGFAVSIAIEAAQFFTYRGMLDIDDLVSNVLGTVVGILIWHTVRRINLYQFVSWLMVGAELLGCVAVAVPAARSSIRTKEIQQFDFTIDSVSVNDEEMTLRGVCYTYSRNTPSYEIFIGDAKVNSTVEGNKYQAVGEKIREKAEVQIKFKGYGLMPTGTFLRPTEDGISVEYVAGDLEEPTGMPDGAVLKAYNEDHDVLVYQDGNRLLWLIGDSNIDRNTEIIYHIHTDEPNKLPDNRIQYEFDNRGFRESVDQKAANELNGIGHYRVFQKEIPEEYHVTAVVVGFNTDGVVTWTDSFRVDK